MHKLARALTRAAVLVLVPLAACDSGTDLPEEDSPVGVYRATTLIGAADGETFDVLASDPNAYIALELRSNGTTTGRFFVSPNPGEEGSGMNVSLDGTWTMQGDKVTLQHPADSGIKDLTYTYADGKLSATGVAWAQDPDPIQLTVVLTRQ